MALPARTVGPFEVSAIGLGCMNLSHAYGTMPSEADGIVLLDRALDLGCTFLDTAAIYGLGANEALIAKAVGHRRSEYVLASKCVLHSVGTDRRLDGSPAVIRETVEGSLRRLGMDHTDLHYLHRLDRKVPIEDSVGEMARLVEEGKIGAIGLSEMSAATIRRAHAVHPIAAVQTEYSLWVRNPEIAVLETCRELGIGFVAFSPVGRGFLAGAVRGPDYEANDIRTHMPRFIEPNIGHNLRVLDAFAALAGDAGCTTAQLSLGWLLARGPDIVPIPGTRSIAHLEEDLAAAGMTFAPDLLERVDALFAAPGAIRGKRYSPPMQAQIDTEAFPGELEELSAA
jgi:hypothetical protein